MTSPENLPQEPTSEEKQERVSSAIRTQRAILDAEFFWFGSHNYMDSGAIHHRLDSQPLQPIDPVEDSSRRIRIEVDEDGDYDVIIDPV